MSKHFFRPGALHLLALCFLVEPAPAAVNSGFPGSARSVAQKLIKAEFNVFCVDPPAELGLTASGTQMSRLPVPIRASGQQRRKLDALVKTGILIRTRVANNHPKPDPETSYYTLSDYGWEQLDFDDETCLVGGELDIAIKDIKEAGFGGAKARVYEVLARVSTTTGKLAKWANDRAVSADVPEVSMALNGVEVKLAMQIEAQKARIEVLTPLSLRVLQRTDPLSPPERSLVARIPIPSKQRLAMQWEKEHSDWLVPCFHITEDSKYPVDEQLFHSNAGYGVAIYEMSNRTAEQRRVIHITLPRLELLQKAGVLVSVEVKGPASKGGNLPGRIYTLAPAFRRLWNDRVGAGCVTVGKHITEVTAMKFWGAEGKLIARKRNVSVELWAKNPSLLMALPDLRKAVEQGTTCFMTLRIGPEGWEIGMGTCDE